MIVIQIICSIHKNTLTELRVWVDLFETKLGINSYYEIKYFIVKLWKNSITSDNDLVMLCHLVLILWAEIEVNFIFCV